MFETYLSETPSRSLPAALQSWFLSFVEDLEQKAWAREFVEAVPSHLPSLRCYDALVPVRMELQRVRERLEKGFYRTSEQVAWDLRLIASNCLLFNDADSELAQHARQLEETVRQIRLPPCAALELPAIERTETSEALREAIEEVRERMKAVWDACGEEVFAALPMYWVEHGAELWGRREDMSRREQCSHPFLWKDVEIKANCGMYQSLSEVGIDCLLVVHTVRAFHPKVRERNPDLEKTVTSILEDIASRRNLELDL